MSEFIPPWMDAAFKELNCFVKEKLGPYKNNPRIMAYLACIPFLKDYTDETPWCAAFIEYCLQQCGIQGTGKPNARSYHNDFGYEINTFGSIVTLWRGSPDSWQGHVGFKIAESKRKIYLLGGNQKNSLNITPYDRNRILSYKFPDAII